jgi:arabinoxylan arabinofuranohydrolase
MNGCGRDAIDPFAILDTGDGGSGKAYLAWNQVGTTPNNVYIAELNTSFTDVTGTVHEISSGLGSPTRYKEGIWMIKQNKTWYCFIADWTGAVESISYSTATSIFGPYKKQHDILNQNTNSATIHAGVVPFLNKWFIFYHTGGNEFGKTINTGTKRVTGIEEMIFEKTGSTWNIPAVPKTYRGVGVPYSYDTIQIDRHSLSGISGVQIAIVDGGEPRGWMVNRITSGGYIRYNDVNFSRTSRNSGEISMRVSSVSSGGSVEFRIDNQNGPLLGTIEIPSTGSLSTWKTITTKLNTSNLPSDSIKNCVLVFKTTSANQYTVNWVSIGKEQTTDITGLALRNNTRTFSLHRLNQTTFSLHGTANLVNTHFFLTKLDGTVFNGTTTRILPHSGECIVSFDQSIAQGTYILSVRQNSRILPLSRVPVFP